MDCLAVRPLLSAYADKETTDAESAQVKKHLAVCASCASEFAFTQAMSGAFSAAPIERPSSDLFERIAAATYARPTLRQKIAQWLAPAPTRWTIGTALAAAITLIVVLPRSENITISTPSPKGDAAPIAAESKPAPPKPFDATIPESKPKPSSVTTIAKSEKSSASGSVAVKPDAAVVAIAGKKPVSASAVASVSKNRKKNAVRIADATPVKASNPETIAATAEGGQKKDAPRLAANPLVKRSERLSPKGILVARANTGSAAETRPLVTKPHHAELPVRTVAPEPQTLVALAPTKSPEPTPAKSEPENPAPSVTDSPENHRVAMAEATRGTAGLRLTLKNAGTARRQEILLSAADASRVPLPISARVSLVSAPTSL